jgi:hypothetical protein
MCKIMKGSAPGMSTLVYARTHLNACTQITRHSDGADARNSIQDCSDSQAVPGEDDRLKHAYQQRSFS